MPLLVEDLGGGEDGCGMSVLAAFVIMMKCNDCVVIEFLLLS